jgi:hypothetical protein
MLGPNVPSKQCSMSCNQQPLSRADSCRASAMSDHFTQHTPTSPNHANKQVVQNHAETDRPSQPYPALAQTTLKQSSRPNDLGPPNKPPLVHFPVDLARLPVLRA